ncbi:replication-relaxation family protein [Nocardiopsis quinghaiensis]|uniref:replication-relaxation family protein n=1 Tax=Nocardiopsis quinghaiensis TaxID=464995 RepID=UPI00123B3B75|nr:replication-relaxation family protein [Nocardiopsis quinghaiensis]
MSDYKKTLIRLAPRITDRDRQILAGLWEHRVMTTHHLHHIYFPDAGPRRARSRLLTLHRYGVLNRFRRHAHDRNAPDHWVLSPTGAVLVALHQGREPDALKFRADRALAVAHSPQLNHMLGLAQTRVDFLHSARQCGAEVEQWCGERECERRYGYDVRPDAQVYWNQGGVRLRAFVEYDTGTESLTQLKNKMRGYKRLTRYRTLAAVVLFVVHSTEREHNAAQKLVGDCTNRIGVYLTTHHRLADPGAGAPIWRSADDPRTVSLHQIADVYRTVEEDQW